jgi:cell shape-determining protein MreC
MEELLGAIGISGPSVAVVIWYVKSRIVKNEKKLSQIIEELKASTNDNKVQEVQINQIKEENKQLREDLRDLKKMMYGKGQI